MTKLQIVAALAASVFVGSFGMSNAHAQTAAPAMAHPVVAKNVVLVHGAWADGSSWAEVIPYLQAAGMKVTHWACVARTPVLSAAPMPRLWSWRSTCARRPLSTRRACSQAPREPLMVT